MAVDEAEGLFQGELLEEIGMESSSNEHRKAAAEAARAKSD